MHISLTDRLDQYVREQVASGLYSNVSEVIRDALRDKLEAQMSEEAKLARLRAEIGAGLEQLDRGETHPLDMQAIIQELDDELLTNA